MKGRFADYSISVAYILKPLVMRVLNVNFYSVKEDGTYVLYCSNERLGNDFQVTIPKRFNSLIEFAELKQGKLTLPPDFSIKVAS